MDALDDAVVRELAADARLTMAELGRRIGLSRTATLARVRRLEGAGTIRGYHADITTSTAGAAVQARVAIAVRTADPAGYVRRIERLGVLLEAESIAGEWDLMALLGADSAEALDAALDRIAGWPETRRTTTYMVLKRHR